MNIKNSKLFYYILSLIIAFIIVSCHLSSSYAAKDDLIIETAPIIEEFLEGENIKYDLNYISGSDPDSLWNGSAEPNLETASPVIIFDPDICVDHINRNDNSASGFTLYHESQSFGVSTIETHGPYEPFERSSGRGLTQDDRDLLARILWAEANDQSFEGQKAVIEVIFNRVLSDEWPNSVYEVLSQKGQFSTWKSRNRVTPTQTQFDVIDAVIAESEIVLPDMEYVYFATRKHSWMDDCIKIEDHYFGR